MCRCRNLSQIQMYKDFPVANSCHKYKYTSPACSLSRHLHAHIILIVCEARPVTNTNTKVQIKIRLQIHITCMSILCFLLVNHLIYSEVDSRLVRSQKFYLIKCFGSVFFKSSFLCPRLPPLACKAQLFQQWGEDTYYLGRFPNPLSNEEP